MGKIDYIYNNNLILNKNNKKKCIYLLLISLFIALDIVVFIFFEKNNILESRIYIYFFIPIFAKIILKENIYRHQILFLSLSFIGFILIIIYNILYLHFSKQDIIGNIFIFIKTFNAKLLYFSFRVFILYWYWINFFYYYF